MCVYTYIYIMILFGLLALPLSSGAWAAREGKLRWHNGEYFRRRAASQQLAPPASGGGSTIFNVLRYSAKGDGLADDTKVISQVPSL